MSEDDWTEWDAGPVARPYTLTGGRTRPRVDLRFDLIDVIGWTGQRVDPLALSPESRQIVEMCRSPMAVADLASALELPLGVVRVLLGDLVHDGLIDVRVAAPQGRVTDQRLLARVLAAVRALLFPGGYTPIPQTPWELSGWCLPVRLRRAGSRRFASRDPAGSPDPRLSSLAGARCGARASVFPGGYTPIPPDPPDSCSLGSPGVVP
jgi:hypothetical protein